MVLRDLDAQALRQEARALGHELRGPASGALVRLLETQASVFEPLRARATADVQIFAVRPPAVPGLALCGPLAALRDVLPEAGDLLQEAGPLRPAAPLLPPGRPAVMGILNVTPDSFSDGGSYGSVQEAVERGLQMIAEGADLLDIGGESTRPGAAPVDAATELERVLPVIDRLLEKGPPAPLSIDTRKPEVARRALEHGCAIVNDVGGLREPGMAEAAARHGASVICMHMAGEPATMQQQPHYDDLFGEIYLFLHAAAQRAASAGVTPGRVWSDPGIGFGKTYSHNLRLIRGLSAFSGLGHPVVVGASRKRFLGPLAGRLEGSAEAAPLERLVPSVVVAVEAARRGAAVLRVHDVAETRQALRTLASVQAGGIVDAAPAAGGA
jgi:dihydropteroate synthase